MISWKERKVAYAKLNAPLCPPRQSRFPAPSAPEHLTKLTFSVNTAESRDSQDLCDLVQRLQGGCPPADSEDVGFRQFVSLDRIKGSLPLFRDVWPIAAVDELYESL